MTRRSATAIPETAGTTETAGKAVHVRKLRETDLPKVLQIIRDSPTAPQWNETQFRQMLAVPDSSDALERTALVAEGPDGIAGFAVASALKVVYPADAEVESIAVAVALRGQGIGRSLMRAVLDWARENGADELRLEVRVSNREAFRLYTALGFRETGLRRGYYANPPEDAICMAYTISAAAVDDLRGR